MRKKIRREPPEISCLSIAHLLKHVDDKHLKCMMEDDLLSKYKNVPPGRAKADVAMEVLASYAPEKLRPVVEHAKKSQPDLPKKYYDVLIMTVVPIEFTTLKRFLKLEEDDNSELSFKSYRFWECNIQCKKEGRELSCLITMIGDATNPRSAIATNSALSRFNFNLAILVGIAAGPKAETQLADVVIANQIIDYENKRLEPDKEKNRPEPQPIHSGLRKQVNFFITSEIINGDAYGKNYRILEADFVDEILPPRKKDPVVKFAPIVAGDKLLADGVTIEKILEQYHDKIRAVEMEANGFVLACEDNNVPWLVFRGISDFGDPGKTGLKKYQANAAYSAILACKLFLENQYSQVCEAVF